MTTQGKILLKIAIPIILVGFFVILVFIALNYESLSLEVYAVFTLVAVFVFLFGFAVGQRFSTPIRELLEKADSLSKGELSSRIYLETKDEFEELARSFNKIAEDLEKSRQDAHQAEGVADVRVRAKTQALEETINNLEQKVKNRAQDLQNMIQESERLQCVAKTRESEIMELKREIKQLKDAIGGYEGKVQNPKKK